VVRPWTTSLSTLRRMAPAPMKPMPVINPWNSPPDDAAQGVGMLSHVNDR
jgi:hypothetical protein